MTTTIIADRPEGCALLRADLHVGSQYVAGDRFYLVVSVEGPAPGGKVWGRARDTHVSARPCRGCGEGYADGVEVSTHDGLCRDCR